MHFLLLRLVKCDLQTFTYHYAQVKECTVAAANKFYSLQISILEQDFPFLNTCCIVIRPLRTFLLILYQLLSKSALLNNPLKQCQHVGGAVVTPRSLSVDLSLNAHMELGSRNSVERYNYNQTISIRVYWTGKCIYSFKVLTY